MISASGRGHCGRKIMTMEVGADQQKILRYWTKNASLCGSFLLAHILPRLQKKTPWGDFVAHLSQMKNLIFVRAYVEPFWSYALPIDSGPRKFEGFPAKFFGVGEKRNEFTLG